MARDQQPAKVPTALADIVGAFVDTAQQKLLEAKNAAEVILLRFLAF